MAEEDSGSLPPNWEAVQDPEGRTYWWNVETNETTWTKPVAVVAKKNIAAGYLAKVQEAPAKTVPSPKLAPSVPASGGAGVASLTKKFASCTASPSSAPEASAPKISPRERRSSGSADEALCKSGTATSVSALKKYQEAKIYMNAKAEAATAAKPPPKVDLYS